MKSLGIGRIAAATIFAFVFLFSSPAAALDSYDFEEVEVGNEKTVGLDFENLNPSATLTFDLSLTSTNQCGFSLPNSELTIPGGEIAQIQVKFSPAAVGPCTDSLQVHYKTHPVKEISLQGSGIEKTASVPAEDNRWASSCAAEKWGAHIGFWNYKGKTISARLQECIESADSHGQAVHCAVNLAHKLRKERILSAKDAQSMRLFAAKSKYHKYKKAKHRVKKAKHRLKKAKHQVKKAKYQVKKAKHRGKKDKHQVKKAKHQMKKAKHQVKKAKHQVKKAKQRMKKASRSSKKAERYGWLSRWF